MIKGLRHHKFQTTHWNIHTGLQALNSKGAYWVRIWSFKENIYGSRQATGGKCVELKVASAQSQQVQYGRGVWLQLTLRWLPGPQESIWVSFLVVAKHLVWNSFREEVLVWPRVWENSRFIVDGKGIECWHSVEVTESRDCCCYFIFRESRSRDDSGNRQPVPSYSLWDRVPSLRHHLLNVLWSPKTVPPTGVHGRDITYLLSHNTVLGKPFAESFFFFTQRGYYCECFYFLLICITPRSFSTLGMTTNF